jgi:hypothetical protein
MKQVLYISFDYPPSTSPGALRTKVICKTLYQNRIEPIVLTINESKEKEEICNRNSNPIKIVRVKCIDALKLLSFRGRSLSWFALPDRWWPWIISGFRKGISLIKANNISLIIVTVPTYSAAVMSLLLAKKSGIPLVLDLRDPFRFRYDPKNVPAHFLFKYLESSLFRNAEKIVTTSEECAQYYSDLYPNIDNTNFVTVKNGYDEDTLLDLQIDQTIEEKKFTLLHSGTLYSIGRNPKMLLLAISKLKNKAVVSSKTFQFIVRGSPVWPQLTKYIKNLNIEDLVKFKESISYNDSITEMMTTSALVVIQGDIFKTQIPSKLYDYLACQKPILTITKPEYATGKEAKRLGLKDITDNSEELVVMLERIIKGKGTIVTDFSQESRQVKSMKVVKVINRVLEKCHGC